MSSNTITSDFEKLRKQYEDTKNNKDHTECIRYLINLVHADHKQLMAALRQIDESQLKKSEPKPAGPPFNTVDNKDWTIHMKRYALVMWQKDRLEKSQSLNMDDHEVSEVLHKIDSFTLQLRGTTIAQGFLRARVGAVLHWVYGGVSWEVMLKGGPKDGPKQARDGSGAAPGDINPLFNW